MGSSFFLITCSQVVSRTVRVCPTSVYRMWLSVSIPRSKAFIHLDQGNSAWQWRPPSPATSPTHSGTSLPKYKSSDVPFLQSFPACQWLQKATQYNRSPGHLEAKLQIPAPPSVQKFHLLAEISSPCTSPTPNHLSSSNCGSLFQVPGTSGKVSLLFSLSSD